ncbi:MAG: RtcB family protein [Terriglobia bacterium]
MGDVFWHKQGDYRYIVPQTYRAGMRVPGVVFADDGLITQADRDRALEQVINVAFLPGIVRASYAMPDIHWGYGFPIGGVAAFGTEDGVISPGGVGYDINCGVRLVKTDLEVSEVRPVLSRLLDQMAGKIPRGVGRHGRVKLSVSEMEAVFSGGAKWAVERGYGFDADPDHIEENGALSGANPAKVSQRAVERGRNQLGTLGAGNHFLEIQEVAETLDPSVAAAFGLSAGQVVVMIHSGSRGVGHQVCGDYIKVMERVVKREGIKLPDRQLGCAPIGSVEQQDYFGAMASAVNYAFANRQLMAHAVRKAFSAVFGKDAQSLGMDLLYDVAHNIAKFEEHQVDGGRKRLCVHRKGATRAFGPGHPSLPEVYRDTGQPVIIPGDMGRSSFVLAGTEAAMGLSWGSACHGAGRVMSRGKAKRTVRLDKLRKELSDRGIEVRAGNQALLAEEAPEAYKDVARVVDVCEGAGLAKRVARMKPLGVLKG